MAPPGPKGKRRVGMVRPGALRTQGLASQRLMLSPWFQGLDRYGVGGDQARCPFPQEMGGCYCCWLCPGFEGLVPSHKGLPRGRASESDQGVWFRAGASTHTAGSWEEGSWSTDGPSTAWAEGSVPFHSLWAVQWHCPSIQLTLFHTWGSLGGLGTAIGKEGDSPSPSPTGPQEWG